MDIIYCITQDIHTLTDTEVTSLLKFLVRECDRRFLDHTEIVEEAEQEIQMEIDMEEDGAFNTADYACVDVQGW